MSVHILLMNGFVVDSCCLFPPRDGVGGASDTEEHHGCHQTNPEPRVGLIHGVRAGGGGEGEGNLVT